MPRPLALVVTDQTAKGVTIQCDLCPVDRQVPRDWTVEEVEAMLREEGWLIKDGVDCCPACRP